jgi:hypothetical protein
MWKWRGGGAQGRRAAWERQGEVVAWVFARRLEVDTRTSTITTVPVAVTAGAASESAFSFADAESSRRALPLVGGCGVWG